MSVRYPCQTRPGYEREGDVPHVGVASYSSALHHMLLGDIIDRDHRSVFLSKDGRPYMRTAEAVPVFFSKSINPKDLKSMGLDAFELPVVFYRAKGENDAHWCAGEVSENASFILGDEEEDEEEEAKPRRRRR